ncbi:hypothetical protein ABT354_26015 [Streptomyces sp. NPDC000594]|uniref:hypothetical protein n=1 Tax=Streptomyces sp. NPDC000594 TaxID=3154261 RepID=UPI0033225295
MDDEQIMRGRVYGADHDDPDPGPRPGRAYAELVGGPLDGLLLDVTGWGDRQRDEGAALPTEIGRYGAGGRAVYRPREPGARAWAWRGDIR